MAEGSDAGTQCSDVTPALRITTAPMRRPIGPGNGDHSATNRGNPPAGPPESASLISAGIERDWPDARGVFVSKQRNAVVWCNAEDHLRIISIERGLPN